MMSRRHTASFCATLVLVAMMGLPAAADLSCTSPDLVAFVFDSGDINLVAPPAVVPYSAAVVLLNPSAPDISGFEFMLTCTNPTSVFRLSETLPPQAINIGDSFNFANGLTYIVGLGTPLPPTNDAMVLVQLQLLDVVPEQRDFFVSPTTPASIPGEIIFASGPNFDLFPMEPISRDFALPVGRLVIEGPELDYCSDEPLPLDLAVGIAFQGDTDNVAGTAAGATDGFDPDFDRPDANLALTFPHPEWGGNFKSDIKALYDPLTEAKQWTFVTTTDFSQSGSTGQQVAIDFFPSGLDTGQVDLRLFDRTTGQSTDLFPAYSYSYFAPAGPDSRTFDLFIGNDFGGLPELIVYVDGVLGEYADLGNRAATAEFATDGYDPGIDIPEPTPPPANYLTASFEHADWPLGPRFQRDVRALFDPLAETKTWPLTVETDQSGMVTLTFAPNFDPSTGYGLFIRDLQTGQTFDLFPSLSYVFQSLGLGTYRFELLIGVSQAPDLDPTFRDIPAGWSLVGPPLIPAPGADTLEDVILGLAPGFAYMFNFAGSTGYNPLAGSDPAYVGTGYWIGTDMPFTWTMQGERALDGVYIPLMQGWNLIGNPMWFPGPVENIQVLAGGATFPWATAVALGLVSNTVYAYDSAADQYVNTLDMQAWYGYWVSALGSDVTLFFDWRTFQTMPARLTAASRQQNPVGYKWETDIHLVDAASKSRTITLGVDTRATAGFDPIMDLPQPPPSPQGGPMLAVQRPEWDLASGQFFTTDIVAADQETVEWRILVSSPTPGNAVLHWDSADWPDGMDYQLYLPNDNRVVVMSMREENAYVMNLGAAAVPLVIRTPNMISGVDDLPGLAYGLEVYPNPFNPMTTLHFEMARSGTAEIRIFSVRGELISTLGNTFYEAGRHQAVWRGTDRQGRNAPSGSYFAKMYVDGQAKGDVVKMSLVR